jgi:hypothetical protein
MISGVQTTASLHTQTAPGTALPIVIGIDARQRYPLGQLLAHLRDAYRDFCKNNGQPPASLINRLHVTLGDFRGEIVRPDGTVNSAPTHADLVQWYEKEEPKLIPPFHRWNECLNASETRIRRGEPMALATAKGIAISYGLFNLEKMLAEHARVAGNFALLIPCDPRLQAIPLYSFLKWHPELEEAFRGAVQVFMDYPNAVIIKTAHDHSKPPFVDVVQCRMEDLQADTPAPHFPAADSILAELRNATE